MSDQRAGCYLCRPDDPSAGEEACNDCDREFWKNPVAIVFDEAIVSLDEHQAETIVRGLSGLSMLVLDEDADITVESVREKLASCGVTPQALTMTALYVREAWHGR